jgi:hypothetical protein
MIKKEKMEHHIVSLQEKVEVLKKQVHDMYLDNVSDVEVEKVKKQKLKIKDEIERCKKKIMEI